MPFTLRSADGADASTKPGFTAVLFDWRGTLFHDETDEDFSWKTGVYRGAILRISNDLYELRKVQQQPKPAAAGSDAASARALVVRTEEENDKYIRQHFGETQRERTRRAAYYASAFGRGTRRGDDVVLRRPMRSSLRTTLRDWPRRHHKHNHYQRHRQRSRRSRDARLSARCEGDARTRHSQASRPLGRQPHHSR